MASVGNLLVENNKPKQFDIFRKIRFMNFWLATLAAAGFIVVMDSFVTVWLGPNFLLPFEVLIVLAINSHMTMMRTSYSVFKEAAGIFYEDRFVPIIESIINIVASIALVNIMGLAGVFLGTILSGLVLYVYSFPKFVYKRLFGRNFRQYIFETVGLALLAAVIVAASLFASRALAGWLGLSGITLVIVNIVMVLVVPNILMTICFAKNENLKFFVKKFLRR